MQIITIQCATEREKNPYKKGKNKITCLQQSNIADYDSFEFFSAMAGFLAETFILN